MTKEREVDGRCVRLTNLDKVLWPEAGFTKGDLLGYYERVAPALLPHLQGRPVTLRRFPDGVDGWNWYQHQWPRGAPDWLPRVRRGRHDLLLIDGLAPLLFAANLAAVELHPLPGLDAPRALVLDLDPGAPAGIEECCHVALLLRERLAAAGLQSFPKTSGAVGLHVYVPLDSSHSFEETKAYARALARTLAAEHPELVVHTQRRSERAGRVLVDWLQNDGARSTVAPYSLRAAPWPTVSTPLTWEEVEGGGALVFLAGEIPARLAAHGELFGPVLELEQRLPAT